MVGADPRLGTGAVRPLSFFRGPRGTTSDSALVICCRVNNAMVLSNDLT